MSNESVHRPQPAASQTVNQLHATEARWFAVYTRSKSEKVVHQLLDKKGIENYLPLQKVTRRYTRKIKHHDIPLISCYIFVKIAKDDYVPVLETENVVNFVKFKKELVAIPEEEMALLKRVVGEADELFAEPGSFKEGDKVELIGGKLTGLKGRLVERQGKKQMVVELETIGFSLRMTVDVTLIRKL